MHDNWQSIPPVCPRCAITVFPEADHSNLIGCFMALRQFVKMCQDDIEQSRMDDFQKPTRQELIEVVNQIALQYEQLGGVYQERSKKLQDFANGKIRYASTGAGTNGPRRSSGHYYVEEDIRVTQHDPSVRTESVARTVVRELLPPDVPYWTEGVVQEQEDEEGT